MKKHHFGVLLILIAIVLTIWGVNLSDSLQGKLIFNISSSPGNKILVLYLFGIVCAVLGILQLHKDHDDS